MQRHCLNLAARFRPQSLGLFPTLVRRCSSPLLTLSTAIAYWILFRLHTHCSAVFVVTNNDRTLV